TQADSAGCGLASGLQMLSFVERFAKSSGLLPTIQPFPRNIGIVGRVLRTGIIARVDDVQKDADFVVGVLSNARSELCVPIVHKGERVGVINLESNHENHFTPRHERFLANLADHAAIAIGNVRLFEERQMQIETLIKFRNLSLLLLSATSLQQ